MQRESLAGGRERARDACKSCKSMHLLDDSAHEHIIDVLRGDACLREQASQREASKVVCDELVVLTTRRLEG